MHSAECGPSSVEASRPVIAALRPLHTRSFTTPDSGAAVALLRPFQHEHFSLRRAASDRFLQNRNTADSFLEHYNSIKLSYHMKNIK